MAEPTSFDITWHHGAYYVSIPNYGGGTVYTAEHVDRLTRENEAMRKALEGMCAVFVPFRLKPVGAPGSSARAEQDEQIAAYDNARAALSYLKEPSNAQD